MARIWLLLLLLFVGCSTAEPRCAGVPGQPEVTVQLLFGRSLKGGGTIDDAAWRDFLARSVTPRFPDGLTVLDGSGQWRQRSTGRIISEPSSVVEIVAEASPEIFTRLDAIRTEYRDRFDQESVGLVMNESCASF
jgi:hypothetical protein